MRPARQVGAVALPLAAALAYYVGARIGFALQSSETPHSVLWLPNSILLGVLLLTPPSRWPVYLLAVWPMQLLVGWQAGAPLLTIALLYFTNVADAALGAFAVRSVSTLPFRFDNLRSTTAFMVLGAVMAPVLLSFADSAILVLTGWSTDFWAGYVTRVRSNILTHLIVVPVVVSMRDVRIGLASLSGRRLLEAGILVAGLALTTIVVFTTQVAPGHLPALLYTPLPLLLWAAVRFGPGSTAFCLLVFALVATWITVHREGPFQAQYPQDAIVALQFFLLALSVPLLVMSSVGIERRRSIAALRASERHARQQWAQLSMVYRTAPVGLAFLDHDLRYRNISDWLAAMNGLPASAHLGRRLRDILPDVADDLEPVYRRVLATGEPVLDHLLRGATPSQPGVTRDWLTSYFPVRDEQGVTLGVTSVVQEVTERRRADDALRQLAAGVSGSTGGPFLRSLVRHLSLVLDADFVALGELVGERNDRVRILAACDDVSEGIEYDLMDTPCENVVSAGPGVTAYASQIKGLFPRDAMLQAMDVESYLGVPLRDSSGRALGLIVVLDRKPLVDVRSAEWMLTIFAARAAAELERARGERQNRRLLHDLGERVKELTALHKAARIFQRDDATMADWLSEIATMLPAAFQYPDVTAARVSFDGLTFDSPKFATSPWQLSTTFSTADGRLGTIDVVYLAERPPEVEGPFLTEERSVIDSLAEMLRAALDRRLAMVAFRDRETALRLSHVQVRDLAGRLITAQEEERARIGRELHDDINQQLAGLSIGLSTLRRHLSLDHDRVREDLIRLQAQTIDLAEDIRRLSHELHPGVLRHAGVVPALEGHCAEFKVRHGVDVQFVSDGVENLPPEISLCLYRVVQEALRNVALHASASHATVALEHAHGEVRLTMSDDGCGFDYAEARRAGGLGLISIDERIRLVNGTLRVVSAPDAGTHLEVRIPCERPA